MTNIIRGQTDLALQDGMNAMLIASGIAVGMLMGTALSKGVINPSLSSLHTSLQDDFDISIPELVDKNDSTELSAPPKHNPSKRTQRMQSRRNKYHKIKENHKI